MLQDYGVFYCDERMLKSNSYKFRGQTTTRHSQKSHKLNRRNLNLFFSIYCAAGATKEYRK